LVPPPQDGPPFFPQKFAQDARTATLPSLALSPTLFFFLKSTFPLVPDANPFLHVGTFLLALISSCLWTQEVAVSDTTDSLISFLAPLPHETIAAQKISLLSIFLIQTSLPSSKPFIRVALASDASHV